MNTCARLFGGLVLLAILVMPIGAQETSIRESRGTAELLLPGEGWRQAVFGRLVPVGATVAVWAGGTVVIGRGASDQSSARVAAGPLTVLTLTSDAPDLLAIGLVAGGVTVQTGGPSVAIATDLATIKSDDGEFSVALGEVRLISGSLVITYPNDEVRVVEVPGRISLQPTALAPILNAR